MAQILKSVRRRLLLKAAMDSTVGHALLKLGLISTGLTATQLTHSKSLFGNDEPSTPRNASPFGNEPSGSRRYDAQGRYNGRTDESGRRYDAQGRYQGRTDANGRHYDEAGRYLGRTDANGRQYDAQGRYLGRTKKTPK
ncbi:MAG: RHS repeat domain-containing protein [Sutterella sp.]|nr:RHS repeat domain-containing protein [Sutterella sp.]